MMNQGGPMGMNPQMGGMGMNPMAMMMQMQQMMASFMQQNQNNQECYQFPIKFLLVELFLAPNNL